MATGRFKVTVHRGPAMRTRVAFPTYAYGRMKSTCLPPVLKTADKVFHKPNSNMEYFIVVLSFAILIYTGVRLTTLIWKDLLTTLKMERVYVDPMVAQNKKVYRFLIQSATNNYNHNALEAALSDLNIAYKINPSGYEVNYLLTNTLGVFCQQRGVLCDEALDYLNYMQQHYCMQDKWIAQRRFSLGILLNN